MSPEGWGQGEEELAWAHQILKLHSRCFSREGLGIMGCKRKKHLLGSRQPSRLTSGTGREILCRLSVERRAGSHQ